MKVTRIEDYKGGWFIGDFEPLSFKTKDFEVCFKHHAKGEKRDIHYHKVGTEINYLVKGKMKIQNVELNEGDIFLLYPYEVSDLEFLDDCTVLIVKTPSVTGDKYVI
jgi:quercetin dioxygenase-like cupin family protein